MKTKYEVRYINSMLGYGVYAYKRKDKKVCIESLFKDGDEALQYIKDIQISN